MGEKCRDKYLDGFHGGEGEISRRFAQREISSSAHSRAKILRALSRFARYTNSRFVVRDAIRGSSDLTLAKKKRWPQEPSFLFGGGGEIRTPAPDLSSLTI